MARRRGVTEFLSVFESIGATFYDIEPDALVMLSDKGIIERVNPGFERMTGYVETDVYGKMITQLISFDGRDDPIRLLHRGGGEIQCRVVASRFRGGKVYLVLRQL